MCLACEPLPGPPPPRRSLSWPPPPTPDSLFWPPPPTPDSLSWPPLPFTQPCLQGTWAHPRRCPGPRQPALGGSPSLATQRTQPPGLQGSRTGLRPRPHCPHRRAACCALSYQHNASVSGGWRRKRKAGNNLFIPLSSPEEPSTLHHPPGPSQPRSSCQPPQGPALSSAGTPSGAVLSQDTGEIWDHSPRH